MISLGTPLGEAFDVLGEMIEVADSEGMEDDTVIPVWPKDVAEHFTPLKVKHVRALLTLAQSESPWISVKERLPDSAGSYFVRVGRYHQPLVAKYERRDGNNGWDCAWVSHWMEIPELANER